MFLTTSPPVSSATFSEPSASRVMSASTATVSCTSNELAYSAVMNSGIDFRPRVSMK